MSQRPARPVSTESFEVTIEALGAGGDGVANHAGDRLFVPWTMPGDHVRVRRDAGHRAEPLGWITRAPGRTAPACPHFEHCGGCVTQHLPTADYLAWKTALARDAAARAGFADVPMAPLAVSPARSRRRATIAVVRSAAGIVLGFHAPASHDIVDVTHCAVLAPSLMTLLPLLRTAFAGVLTPSQRCDVALTATDSGVDVLVIGTFTTRALMPLVGLPGIARLSHATAADHGGELVALHRAPRVMFDGIAVMPPPHAFLQATEDGQRAILAAVRAGIGKAKRIADLFAGCGTLALPLARSAHLLAVDGEPAALAALDAAARASGLGARVKIVTRDLERRPMVESELEDFDAVVFDPPRDGAREQAAALARSKVPRVVAVSCNPATFARDAASLAAGGYRLESLTPIDQFLWSAHLELVGVFTRPRAPRR